MLNACDDAPDNDKVQAVPVRGIDMEFTTPPALEPGDTVGLVAPSRPIPPGHVARFEDRMNRHFDLSVRVFDTVEQDEAHLRDHPEERAADLEAAFRDDAVDAVMATTGGDDQIRVLKHLDPDVFESNPKRFYGYSDNDNFRLFLWNLGIPSYAMVAHPDVVVGGDLHTYTREYLERAFFDESLGTVDPAEEWTDRWYDFDDDAPDDRTWFENTGWEWYGEASVSGPVWGGCLEIVEWQAMADRWLPAPADLDGAVLALEVSEDLPDAVRFRDLLRALGERGWLQRFDGLLVGRPPAWTPETQLDHETYRGEIREAVVSQLAEYNPDATAVFGVDFGHTTPTFPLPLGAAATVDPVAQSLVFE